MSESTEFESTSDQEAARIDGGVAPIYLPNGDVITCTDPRRWGGVAWPPLKLPPFITL